MGMLGIWAGKADKIVHLVLVSSTRGGGTFGKECRASGSLTSTITVTHRHPRCLSLYPQGYSSPYDILVQISTENPLLPSVKKFKEDTDLVRPSHSTAIRPECRVVTTQEYKCQQCEPRPFRRTCHSLHGMWQPSTGSALPPADPVTMHPWLGWDTTQP